jgi:hypothetical protein
MVKILEPFFHGGIIGAGIASIFCYGFYKGLETKTKEYEKAERKKLKQQVEK